MHNHKVAVCALVDLFGKKLVAYIARENNVAVVEAWMRGEAQPSDEVAERLRIALDLGRAIMVGNEADICRAWFIGIKEGELPNDMSPARFVREGPLDELEDKLGEVLRTSRAIGTL